jgi:hypothetical protein
MTNEPTIDSFRLPFKSYDPTNTSERTCRAIRRTRDDFAIIVRYILERGTDNKANTRRILLFLVD